MNVLNVSMNLLQNVGYKLIPIPQHNLLSLA
ncbi:Uncharacterised protein [Vibrio cholerae]|nr:Uncharacterised protein [Vibrio cholerae]